MERLRLENDAMNSKFVSLNNNRSSHSMVNGFRKQLQQPVDGLMASARQLLEFELQPDLKQVAESVLERAIGLQSHMHESDMVNVVPDETVEQAKPVEDGASNDQEQKA